LPSTVSWPENIHSDCEYCREAIAEASRHLVDIAEEDWETIERLVRKANYKNGRYPINDDMTCDQNTPYTIDAEFDVKQVCQHKGIHNSTCIYRQIARLVKPKEMGDIGDAHRKVIEEAVNHGHPREYDLTPTDSVTSDGTKPKGNCPKCGAIMMFANCISDVCNPQPTDSVTSDGTNKRMSIPMPSKPGEYHLVMGYYSKKELQDIADSMPELKPTETQDELWLEALQWLWHEENPGHSAYKMGEYKKRFKIERI